jgi:hypothetical protein
MPRPLLSPRPPVGLATPTLRKWRLCLRFAKLGVIGVLAVVAVGCGKPSTEPELPGNRGSGALGRVTHAALTSVSCPSPSECVAVGSFARGNSVRAIPLAELWRDRKWHPMALPDGADVTGLQLRSVACPRVDFCIAVGTESNALGAMNIHAKSAALIWRGSTWRSTQLPTAPGEVAIVSVSCASPDFCTAVGTKFGAHDRYEPLAVAWDGSRWHPRPTVTSRPASLLAVDCSPGAALGRCFAVGFAAARSNSSAQEALVLAMDHRGVRQTLLPLGLPLKQDSQIADWLTSVSCYGPSLCVASGNWGTRGLSFPWSLERQRGRWRTVAFPSGVNARRRVPKGVERRQLAGVSCTRSHVCVAVGNDAQSGAPFVGFLKADQWTVRSVDGQHAELDALSCSSSGECVAVGASGTLELPGGRRLLALLVTPTGSKEMGVLPLPA